ncbi:unnamed protein product [Arabidopsis halleri]
MTAVEFSKQHPYLMAKLSGLLDLKFGSIEVKFATLISYNPPVCYFRLGVYFNMQANEKWLVLPGIVSSFILSDLLKKEGFSVAAKDTVKANGMLVKVS